MKKEIIFRMASPMRDEFKIKAFRFGSGAPTLAIVGAMRGDEIQQQYICSQMVKSLKKLEDEGEIVPGHEVMVIPNANHFSMNIEKRFWAMDSTDINRMFPGYDQGETTQRIAAALFEHIKGYAYGIQLASFYIPGDFIPHIRLMETGYQPEAEGNLFGLPYIYVKAARPFDTTILNYNWQIWGTKAFSLYSGKKQEVDEETAREAVRAILRFMNRMGIISKPVRSGYTTTTIRDKDIVNIKADTAGLLFKIKNARQEVTKGDLMAQILDPYDGSVRMNVTAPASGSVFFAHDKPLVLQNTLLYKIVEEN